MNKANGHREVGIVYWLFLSGWDNGLRSIKVTEFDCDFDPQTLRNIRT